MIGIFHILLYIKIRYSIIDTRYSIIDIRYSPGTPELHGALGRSGFPVAPRSRPGGYPAGGGCETWGCSEEGREDEAD